MPHRLITLLFTFLFPVLLSAQISGRITDSKGIPLPYATVYVDGTTTGTVSNEDGHYELNLERKGRYTIVFQYIGYQRREMEIDYKTSPVQLNVVLEEDVLLLEEVVIAADREDPAYRIIREAIKKRSYYKRKIKSYEADLYVKGLVKVLGAPDKILGNEVGNMGGVLDSSRQGIIYLSESKSILYFQQPDQLKEVMVSSVKSGDNTLFTANQFSMADFNLYDNYLNFGRSVVSPIAETALNHYAYVLENMILDKSGATVFKIKVTPKESNAPLLHGYIYIVDELWNIHSADFHIKGMNLKSQFVDTIAFKQIYLPVKKDTWCLFHQNVTFKASFLGFSAGANFTYVFSDYKLDRDLTEIFKNSETFRVEEDALKRDSTFWAKIRPVPLTREEQFDYVRKDSLSKIWNSEAYRDSMDRKSNKLQVSDIALGYTYRNSFRNYTISYPSPLSTLRFNAMEGFNLNVDANYTWSDSTNKRLIINPLYRQGFSDKVIKPALHINYRFDNVALGEWYFNIGRSAVQFDERNPVSLRGTTYNSLFYKANRIRLYLKDYITLGYRQEIINSLYLDARAEWTKRREMLKKTEYSLSYPRLRYPENIPNEFVPPSAYGENTYILLKLSLRWRPGQTYSSYPYVRIRTNSRWPEIKLDHRLGISLDNRSSSWLNGMITIRDTYMGAGLWGYANYQLQFGSSIWGQPSYFADYFHIIGNEFTYPIDPDFASFNLMPFYRFSTTSTFFTGHYRHHFNGFIEDKIPGFNKTPLKFVTGLSAMWSNEYKWYGEFTFGIENITIGPLVLGGIEYSVALYNDKIFDHGPVVRLSQLFGL